jgi:hypothetical protein
MSSADNSPQFAPFACRDAAPLLVFYACDEVSAAEKVLLEEHLASCSSCSAQLLQERNLLDALGTIVQPADVMDTAGVLLAQCRSGLSEKIDDLAAPAREERWQPFGWARRWMALRPAWSAAALVIFGIVLGAQLLPWWESANDVAGPAVNVLAAPKLSDDQLSKMAVSGIRFSAAPDAGGENIQLHLNAEQPMVLNGNVDDRDVRRVLTFVVENGGRFDVDARLDCLDALKSRSSDAQVRQALLSAAGKDQSAAVRMKALESLRDAAGEQDVRDALLGILSHDPSAGVRIEAVNLLVRSVQRDVRNAQGIAEVGGADSENDPNSVAVIAAGSAESSVGQMVRALALLQQKDPSRDVRLRSAAALRQIGVQQRP